MPPGSGSSERDQRQDTYFHEVEHPRPKTEVWALSPTALVHDGPLVCATTDQVHRDGDQGTMRVSGYLIAS